MLNPTFVVDMDITFASNIFFGSFFFSEKGKKNYVAVKF